MMPTIKADRITERIDAITRIPNDYRTPTPPIPRSVKVELTARCDFNCFFCATAKKLRRKADIDESFYRRIVAELRDAGVEELGVFYLGESFLCPWLSEAIRYAKQDCGFPYVFLTTNGRLATPDRVAACMAAGLDSLKFSFNNADPEQFQAVTQVRGKDFFSIIENIKSARRIRDENGFHCGLYASSIQYDGEQFRKMEAAVNEIRPYVDEHYWLPLYGQAGLMLGTGGTVPVAGNPGRLGALRAPIPCWSIFTEGHITFDGRLSACCFDHDGRFTMGDLMNQTFVEAWASFDFQRLRAPAFARRRLRHSLRKLHRVSKVEQSTSSRESFARRFSSCAATANVSDRSVCSRRRNSRSSFHSLNNRAPHPFQSAVIANRLHRSPIQLDRYGVDVAQVEAALCGHKRPRVGNSIDEATQGSAIGCTPDLHFVVLAHDPSHFEFRKLHGPQRSGQRRVEASRDRAVVLSHDADNQAYEERRLVDENEALPVLDHEDVAVPITQ